MAVRITLLRIRNFRSLVDVTLPLTRAVVIIGENNTGKSAVLDALRFALSRPGGRRVQPTEYDFHMADSGDDPRTSEGIIVELVFSENAPDEWPETIVQRLLPVIQTHAAKDIRSIYLRYTYKFSAATKSYGARWEFTNARGEELKGKGVLGSDVMPFLLKVTPPFYLSALRDVSDEFSPRSQFWGRLLRALDIPEAEQVSIQEELEEINERILAADPRLKRVTDTLELLQKVVGAAAKDTVSVRAVPLRIWDLLQKADVVLKAKGTTTALPLIRHGQGVQSLAVLFLFQAFVEHLLEDADKGSEPLLSLEEPEAHLHPQAARALWQQINGLSGQKLVTSHSPYFVQHVPFRNVVVLRRVGARTKSYWLPSVYSVRIPGSAELDAFVAKHAAKYAYDFETQELEVTGSVDDSEFKGLLACFTDKATRAERQAALRDLRDRSANYISQEELDQLETFARRIRGEVLFARGLVAVRGPERLHANARVRERPRFAARRGRRVSDRLSELRKPGCLRRACTSAKRALVYGVRQ